MHIAWLGKKSPFCGNVTYSREITQALQERGYQVSFLHFDHERDLDGSEPLAEREVSLPYLFKSQITTIPSPSSRRCLVEALASLQPDVVHASLSLSPLDLSLPDICQDLNLPLVVTFHPAFDRKLTTLSARTQHLTYQVYAPSLARCDRVIVFSNLQRDVFVRLGVPPEKVIVVPNGVDVSKYSPGPSGIKSSLGARQLFVYQGRLSPEKNVDALLKAWKAIPTQPGCILAIVGNGPLEQSMRLFYGGDSTIQWLGFVEEEQRRIDILRGADVFILPSLVEGLSLSLLEAMACGTACIATDAGADGEVLDQGAGIVLDTQRVSHQLETILPLVQTRPEMVRSLGQKARQRVLERYTISTNVSHLEQIYHSLAGYTAPLYVGSGV
ncbi:MAG: glycosyltransferase family 4 protein [Cyanobacteria bacterium]|nr:glycosyltransferase family 4 protein [Cyanobacteriota bacterium]MDA0867100.1 glycosyltransferase family 4 protein [Cyanobacteriota bacterium]